MTVVRVRRLPQALICAVVFLGLLLAQPSLRGAAAPAAGRGRALPAGPAAMPPPLNVVSDGHLGSGSTYFPDNYGVQYYINSDNGVFYSQYSNFPWEVIVSPAKRYVSQPNGPDVLVLDFTDFVIWNPSSLITVIGSHPVVIATTGDISISGGSIVVWANGGVGGSAAPGYVGSGIDGAPSTGGVLANAGTGGQGVAHVVSPAPTPWGWDVGSAGGGGGGGGASNGANGLDGGSYSGAVYQLLGGPGGGAQPVDVLLGGGGGGQGGFSQAWESDSGGNGGQGGGALMFASGGSFLVTGTGAIHADGAAGQYYTGYAAGGGGGGGGYLLFSAVGNWENDGIITVRGGSGSVCCPPAQYPQATDPSHGGVGSGGRLVITGATAIDNEGTIDISGAGPNGGGLFSAAGLPVTGAGAIIGNGVVPTSTVTTPAGSDVVAHPAPDATVIFSSVTTAGTTTAITIDPISAGTVPPGFTLENVAYDITTTAVYTVPVTVCFSAPTFTDPTVFSRLRILHGESGVLVDRTILSPNSPAPDFGTKTLCAGVNSLSPFVLALSTPSDTTPPVLALPGPMTLEATGPAGAVAFFVVSANDAVSGPVPVTCVPVSGSKFAITTTTVNCSATDLASNTGTGSFTVTVRDTTPPTITGTPANMSVLPTGATGAVVTYSSPTASDIVSGAVPVTCLPASGSLFPFGTTTVTCTAKDAALNAATSSFHVTVATESAPKISGAPFNLKIEATGPGGAIATYPAISAIDAWGGSLPVVCTPVSGSLFPMGKTTGTCKATDAHAVSTSVTFTVTVADTTPPTLINVPHAITAEATSSKGAAVTFTAPTATDLVTAPIAVKCNHTSGQTFVLGATTVTCTAKDHAGNTGTASFTITVVDTVAPTIAITSPTATTYMVGQQVTATYTCGDTGSGIATCTGPVKSGTAINTKVAGTFTFTVVARDVAGNVTTKGVTYAVK